MIISTLKSTEVQLFEHKGTPIIRAFGDFCKLKPREFSITARRISQQLQDHDHAYFDVQAANPHTDLTHYEAAADTFARRLPPQFRLSWRTNPIQHRQIRHLTKTASATGFVKMAAFHSNDNAANFIHRPGLSAVA